TKWECMASYKLFGGIYPHITGVKMGIIGNERERLDSIEPEVKKQRAHLFGAEGNPPRSTHISTIDAIDTAKARPARIKRV
ncbi:unnamed protein product, partial [marine sediment metagenome]